MPWGFKSLHPHHPTVAPLLRSSAIFKDEERVTKMQVTETNSEGLKRQYTIVVPAEEIEKRMVSRLEELGTQVRLPGFRPGKVPLTLLRKRYGEAVKGEILEAAVGESTNQALTEKSINPATQPNVDIKTFEDGKDLEFSIDLEILPDIEPMDFGQLKLTKLMADVTDEALDESLDRIAKANAELEDKDDGAEMGDLAVIDFVGKLDGEAFDGGSGENYRLELGSRTFVDTFEDQLVGIKAGEMRTVKVTFPDDYHNAELASAKAEFDVTANEVKARNLPTIDEEFAKKVGFDDVDGLKDAAKEALAGEYERLSRTRLKRDLLDALSDGHDFDVPQGLVDGEFNAIWTQIQNAKEQGNLDPEDFGKSDDQLHEEYTEIATRRVRLGLLLSSVGDRNSLNVTEDELRQALAAQAQQFPGQEQAIVNYYQNNPEAIEQIRAPMFEDKVVDFILEMADVTDETVDYDTLAAEPEDAPEAKKPAKKAAAKKKPAKKTAAKKTASKKKADEGDSAEG